MQLLGPPLAGCENACLRGSGTGEPLGVIDAPAAIKVNRTPPALLLADIAGVSAACSRQATIRATGMFSPTSLDVLQLKDPAATAPMFLSIDQGVVAAVWKLVNFPVDITEKVPTLGTTGRRVPRGPVALRHRDRMSLEIAASERVNFLANQMTWQFVQRFDGRLDDRPVALQDGTSEVSAVCHSSIPVKEERRMESERRIDPTFILPPSHPSIRDATAACIPSDSPRP